MGASGVGPSCEYRDLPVTEVQLDYSNPRIRQLLELQPGEITAERVFLALNVGGPDADPDAPTFQSLERSIKTHGRLIHPILVNRQPDGKLVAIDGNTRLAIYMKFREGNVKGNWDQIPAMVYDNLDEARIDAIRLQSHLVGPRPWDPYSKAKYLHYLSNTEHLTTDQIVDFCGGKQREVLRYIDAYEDMERYYRPQLDSDDLFDPSRFSAFVEVQNPKRKQAIVSAGFDMKDFGRWVRDQLMYPNDKVRKLPQILANPVAKKVFLEHGAREAVRHLDAPAQDSSLQAATLDALAREVSKRIRTLPFDELKELEADPDGPKAIVLLEARDELIDVCSRISDGA